MIYTKLTNEAMRIAYAAHHGQTNKSGIPYIYHPIHLAEQMADEYTTCVALLHDVVEDTDVTLEDLAKSFPKEVVDAVALMTHADGVDYFDYVRKIRTNPIAKAVKLADLTHNSDTTRMDTPDEASIKRWENKYRKAFEILKEEGKQND